MAADVRISARFEVERDGAKYFVRFTPAGFGWWIIVTVTDTGGFVSNHRKRLPPNFTNAIKVLELNVPKRKKPKGFRVVR